MCKVKVEDYKGWVKTVVRFILNYFLYLAVQILSNIYQIAFANGSQSHQSKQS